MNYEKIAIISGLFCCKNFCAEICQNIHYAL